MDWPGAGIYPVTWYCTLFFTFQLNKLAGIFRDAKENNNNFTPYSGKKNIEQKDNGREQKGQDPNTGAFGKTADNDHECGNSGYNDTKNEKKFDNTHGNEFRKWHVEK